MNEKPTNQISFRALKKKSIKVKAKQTGFENQTNFKRKKKKRNDIRQQQKRDTKL